VLGQASTYGKSKWRNPTAEVPKALEKLIDENLRRKPMFLGGMFAQFDKRRHRMGESRLTEYKQSGGRIKRSRLRLQRAQLAEY
jgi:hypothetical protein